MMDNESVRGLYEKDLRRIRIKKSVKAGLRNMKTAAMYSGLNNISGLESKKKTKVGCSCIGCSPSRLKNGKSKSELSYLEVALSQFDELENYVRVIKPNRERNNTM